MTYDDIAEQTGVGDSTFNRWANGEWTRLPTVSKVVDFFMGLDEDPEEALVALGIRGRDATAPRETPLDPDLSRIGRILADPGVPEAEKQAIRHTIRMLARAARAEHEPAD